MDGKGILMLHVDRVRAARTWNNVDGVILIGLILTP